MPVSIGINPAKAYQQLGRVERELRALVRKAGGNPGPSASQVSRGRRDQVRLTGRIRQAIAITVTTAIREVSSDIDLKTPRYSYWLRANWNHIQGDLPLLEDTPTPREASSWRRRDEDEEPPFLQFVQPTISGSVNLDGTKAQYIYNTVEYADEVALGNFPKVSAERDWYLTIEQQLRSGRYIRNALEEAKRRLGA